MSEVGGQGLKGTQTVTTGGEANTGANVGVGLGLIFRDKTGVIINFKTLLAGANITINNLANEVEIVASAIGEANTISSLGGGTVQLVATIPKLGVDLRTKSLSVSAPINVTDAADLITLALDLLVNADISASAAIALSKLQNISTARLLGRESAGAGVIEEISLNATLELIAATTIGRAALTGDVTAPSGSNVLTYNPLSIVNADVSLTAAILQSKLAPLVNADLPFGTAFQRKRTNAGVTAIEDFTEEAALVFVIGDAVAVISTGIKVHIRVPFDCEITRWTLLAKESGSIVIDVNRYTSMADFDSGTKASITGTDTPDLVADKGDESTALTGWTTVLNQGDILEAEVDSATTITRVTLELRVNKRG